MIKVSEMVVTKFGLVNITTKRQKTNGTEMYFDPETNVKYGVYESGYVRRILPKEMMYPVNKRERVEVAIRNYYTGELMPYVEHKYIRIASHMDRLERMVEAVENYRMTKKIFYLQMKYPKLSCSELREMAKTEYKW